MAAFPRPGCTDTRRHRSRTSCGLYSVPAATVHSYQRRTRQRRAVCFPHRSRRTHGIKHPIKDTSKQSNAAETPVNAQKRYITQISRRITRHRRREAALPGPDTATNVEPRGISMDTSSRPAPIRIAAIRPKVAKVADSRKVDSRRIVGKSPESR